MCNVGRHDGMPCLGIEEKVVDENARPVGEMGSRWCGGRYFGRIKQGINFIVKVVRPTLIQVVVPAPAGHGMAAAQPVGAGRKKCNDDGVANR